MIRILKNLDSIYKGRDKKKKESRGKEAEQESIITGQKRIPITAGKEKNARRNKAQKQDGQKEKEQKKEEREKRERSK